jgi:hypothetical protein
VANGCRCCCGHRRLDRLRPLWITAAEAKARIQKARRRLPSPSARHLTPGRRAPANVGSQKVPIRLDATIRSKTAWLSIIIKPAAL